jgi:iron complex outermembrane receptor protein
VLINGKRRHQSALVNVNGTVNRGSVGTDLSAIPATSIERIEILRDGAAAQYGSDAIAGVINIVLKKKTGLLEANASFGMYNTEYEKNYALYKINNKTDDPNKRVHDGENFQASVGYGFRIGKGSLVLTGEYIQRSRTNRTGTYTGAVYPNVGGVNRDDSIMSAKGVTRERFDMYIGNSKMKGGTLFFNFSYPIGENIELYAFGGYSRKKGNAGKKEMLQGFIVILLVYLETPPPMHQKCLRSIPMDFYLRSYQSLQIFLSLPAYVQQANGILI